MAATIEVEGRTINKGNFSFVGQVLGSDLLADRFFEMEKHYLTNRPLFSNRMRHAIEAFTYEEICRVYGMEFDDSLTQVEAKRLIREHLCDEKRFQDDRVTSEVKNFLNSRCNMPQCWEIFKDALQCWRGDRYRKDFFEVRKMIGDLYNFSCNEHHEQIPGVKVYNEYEATERNCEKYARVFFYLVKAYCEYYYPEAKAEIPAFFDAEKVPIEDYVPANKSDSQKFGVAWSKDKRLYIREEAEDIKFYILCNVDTTQTENREIDVLEKIWADDSDFDLRNVIRLREKLPAGDHRVRFVFSFPSKPMRLSRAVLKEMTLQEKEKAFFEAKRAITALHRNEPPLYHRDITHEAFVICKIRNGYKLFLNAFDCVKDTDENALYTVSAKVAANMEEEKKLPYIFPALVNLRKNDAAWKKIDWMQADRYSLARLGAYIFTGEPDLEALQKAPEVSEEIKQQIEALCRI